MGLVLENGHGQTPLDPGQISGLRIKTISSQEQLNEFEQTNINEALKWLGSKRVMRNLFSELFMRQLHKQMFGMVWKWAGKYRIKETNIGINWINIPIEVKVLVDDVLYWIEQEIYLPDEIAIRFKYRLVSIHCFPNGNGRHSRIMADLIMVHQFRLPKFSWGQHSLLEGSLQRKAYLNALHLADRGDFSELVKFANS
jgi:Fic-DOC domain mobile mystery protein B